ncbi:MAG TPA: hypothetical protein VNO21_21055, partial [Polyangiaceae bacterium]|nr:hypothetical protein [Polyangiaceae bacterium]
MAVMISRAGSASFSAFAASALAFAACAGTKPPDPVMEPHGVTVELSELEIHGDGIDRFVRCPPSGSLGQSWIPARVTEEPHDASLTERAIEQMLKPFRSCYTKGTLHRPDTEGRAAIVLRTGSNGKSTVENYATCGLAGEVVQCMITEAAHGMAPAPGTVVVIP